MLATALTAATRAALIVDRTLP
jgi:catechol 2,3-dioxygenase-like lactoylglutathione lyase family enzyme